VRAICIAPALVPVAGLLSRNNYFQSHHAKRRPHSCLKEAKRGRDEARPFTYLQRNPCLGLITWTFWGNPEMGYVPRLRTAQSLKADPNLKLISERSASMRTER
jgi:hypothetical protein